MYVARQSSTRSTSIPAVKKTAASVHGELMANCLEPQKLLKAAAFFGKEGLPHHAQSLMHKARVVHDVMHGARAIVLRCRAGDQHAMALAKGIGEQARAGNKRAQLSAFLIQEYTKANPPSSDGSTPSNSSSEVKNAA